ncbi:MAG: DUF3772 domain-containing protein, partial [Haliea sp.]
MADKCKRHRMKSAAGQFTKMNRMNPGHDTRRRSLHGFLSTFLLAGCVSLAGLSMLMLPGTAAAQTAPAATASDTLLSRDALDKARDDIAKVQARAAISTDDAELLALRDNARATRARGQATADALQPQLDSVAARLAQLGAPPEGSKDAPDVAAQRAELESSRSKLDADIRLARLLVVEADQIASQVTTQRRQGFQARLFERTPSILGTHFWREVRDDLPRDARKLRALGNEMRTAFAAAPLWLLVAVPLGWALVWALRIWAEKILTRLTARHVAASRLRRSLHALTVLLLW